jgi:hypothetical protein
MYVRQGNMPIKLPTNVLVLVLNHIGLAQLIQLRVSGLVFKLAQAQHMQRGELASLDAQIHYMLTPQRINVWKLALMACMQMMTRISVWVIVPL